MSLKDDLSSEVSGILSQAWNIRDGQVVPSSENVVLAGGGIKLDATVLYADLAQSSKLATDFQQKTAAKVIKVFLHSMCKLINAHNGKITSFDGDRVMAIFLGGSKNTNAVTCALKMNYAVKNIIAPQVRDYFKSIKDEGFTIAHGVGVDRGNILAVRTGIRGSNDLVWIGRAPNLAARLSDLREDNYSAFITGYVFGNMRDSAKYGGDPKRLMWEKRSLKYLEESITVYRSNWTWTP